MRGLPLIERNQMVVLLRYRGAITRRHRAAVDRFVELLLPGHLLRSLLFRRLGGFGRGRFGFRRRRRCGRGRRSGWRRRSGRRRRRRCGRFRRRGLGQHQPGRQGNQRQRRRNQKKSAHHGKSLHWKTLQNCPAGNVVSVIRWRCAMQAGFNGLFAARCRVTRPICKLVAQAFQPVDNLIAPLALP